MEGIFARILDFYGILWQYEPRTFALEWDDEGKVSLAFTPDFFLPEQNLYVELTVLRPKRSTLQLMAAAECRADKIMTLPAAPNGHS